MAVGHKLVKLKFCTEMNKLCLFKVFILIVIIGTSIEVDEEEFVKDTEQDGRGENLPISSLRYRCSLSVHSSTLKITPLPYRNKISVTLTYNKSAFDSQAFRILLFNGSGLSDCSNVSDARLKGRHKVTTSSRIEFEDLDAGRYCVKAQYCLSLMFCCPNHTYYTLTLTVPDEANGTYIEMNPMRSVDPGVPASDILYIILGIALPLTLIGIIVLLWCRRRKEPLPFHHTNCGLERMQLFAAISKKPAVPVFILYYPDCDHHMAAVNELSNFLGRNNCQVSYDAVEKPEMAVNKIGWIAEKLGDRYKILVVNSRKAFAKQQEWLQNKKSIWDEENEVFRSALAIISHRSKQAFDYQRLFMLRPSCVSKEHVLRDICPGKLYDVPNDLQVLLCHLHNLDPQSVDFDELEKGKTSYDALEHLLNGMTDYDDRGNLTSGCRRCGEAEKFGVFLPSADRSHNLIDV